MSDQPEIYDLLTYFELVDKKKIGNFYKNTIFIQDNLVFKLQKSKELNQLNGLYFSYTYKVPLLANNINISSNHNIIRNEITDKGYDDITLITSSESIKGKLKKIEHINEYSIITLIDGTNNNEISLKVKEYSIKRELNTKKDIELTILFPEKIINNNLNINIFYRIDLEHCLINNDFWFFHHYLYINNELETGESSRIYETTDELDNFTLTSKIFIKPLCIGENSVTFNKINFIDKYINNNTLKIRQQQEVVEQQEREMVAPHSKISRKEEEEQGIMTTTTNILESIEGNIILSSNMETSYLILSNNKLKGRLINIIELDISFISEDYPFIINPITLIVFVPNFLKKNTDIIVVKNTIPQIPPGKLTIYGIENEEFLNSNKGDLLLTSQTDKIDLGESNILNLSYKLLKNENNYNNNSIIKIIQLKIVNLSHSKTRLTIKFNHVDFIIVLYQQSINNEEEYDLKFDINSIGDILKDKHKLIFQSKESNVILLDFILQPSSDEYVILYIRLKN